MDSLSLRADYRSAADRLEGLSGDASCQGAGSTPISMTRTRVGSSGRVCSK